MRDVLKNCAKILEIKYTQLLIVGDAEGNVEYGRCSRVLHFEPIGRAVVHYEKGGHNGAPEFVAGIPDDWSEENVIDLILRPLEDANAQFPAREVPARAYNCGTLFRWWAGEKPE